MRYIQLITLLLIAGPGLRAQKADGPRGLVVLPSPRGNYVVVSPMRPTTEDSVLMQNTAYVEIERGEFTSRILEKGQAKAEKLGADTLANRSTDDNLKTRTITRFRRPATVSELRKLVSDEYLVALKQATNQTTDEEFLKYLQTHLNPDAYGLLSGGIDLQLLLGNVFLDTDIQAGLVYYYRVFRVDKAGKRAPWAEGTTVAGAENKDLKQLKAKANRVVGLDSLVAMTWALPVSQFSFKAPPVPTTVDLEDPAFRQSLAVHMTNKESIRARVMLLTTTGWKKAQTLIPTLTPKGDSLVFYFQKNCVPEETVRAFLVPEDIVANPGTPSDTSTAVAISQQKIALIYSTRTLDTTNAIRVSWPKLPAKAYYTGIEITRDTGTDSTFAVLTQLSPQDSVYVDYKVRPGITYTYRVRPLFIPLQGLAQSVPAEAVGSCTKFIRPLPVTDLQISNEGRHVRLNWKGDNSPTLFAYYVYRGTSRNNLSLASATIRNATTYLDSSDALSGRTEYFYSVMTVNLTQDTSQLAPPVSIRPQRSIETTYPKIVEATLVNKVAWLSWNDVRLQDNILTGYILQRRSERTGPYQTLSATPLRQPSATDANLQPGQIVWYRVAAITAFGDTSAFSEPTELTVPRPAPEPVFTFYVRNITEGVEVSWPGVSNGLRQMYGIYRREAESDTFDKIGEVASRNTLFVDNKVQTGVKYVYSVTAIEAGNRESKQVKSEAIIRE